MSACEHSKELILQDNLSFHVNFVSGAVEQSPRYTYKAYEYISPASCQKIITAMAAYKVLTPNYHFETKLKAIYQKSSIKTLILIGSGDPTLSFEELKKLFSTIKGKTISGPLIVDISAYQTPEWCPSWMESDKGTAYASPLSGLIVDKNYFHFSIITKNLGSKVIIEGIDHDMVENNLHVNGKHTKLDIYWKNNKIVFNGTVAPHQVLNKKISPYLSETILRHKLKQVLKQNNIIVKKEIIFTKDRKISETIGSESHLIQTHKSEPILTMLVPLLKQSDNLIADSLYLKIAHLLNLDCHHWQEGGEVIKYIMQQYYNISLNDAVITDGSGLSRHNRIQPIVLWSLLNKFIQYKDLLELLPESQEKDTTLERRLVSVSLKAKTGSMSSINGLAGCYLSRNRRPEVFFLMISNFIAPVGDIYKEQELLLQHVINQ